MAKADGHCGMNMNDKRPGGSTLINTSYSKFFLIQTCLAIEMASVPLTFAGADGDIRWG
jgi:hypothetical protein